MEGVNKQEGVDPMAEAMAAGECAHRCVTLEQLRLADRRVASELDVVIVAEEASQ